MCKEARNVAGTEPMETPTIKNKIWEEASARKLTKSQERHLEGLTS